MKGKNIFTKQEFEELKYLISQRLKADKSRQKIIRNKMRAIGFWGRDDYGIIDCHISDLESLVRTGIIKVIGNKVEQDSIKERNTFSPVNHTQNEHFKTKSRKDSDEYYVIDICDKVLGLTASRQHRFDFLVGDTGRKLPVDAYYKELNLVVEYCESQHTESTPFFDNKQTVSGVSRGEQRRRYDSRRAEVLPKYGIKLLSISYTEFGTTKKIKRDYNKDKEIITHFLRKNNILK